MNARERDALLAALKDRFEQNMQRHGSVAWSDVAKRLERKADALKAVGAMEASGGEPDVVELDDSEGTIIFCDCSVQSPTGRRSLCYDQEALESRKKNKPSGSALGMTIEMGIELLSEEQYRRLQQLGEFDTTTSSWITTPADVRALGGALFCDRRYGRVFVYHNGAESYYAARGFRGLIRV